MGWFAKAWEYWRLAGDAAGQAGVTRRRILLDMMQQRFGPGQQGLSEYFDHRTFDSIQLPPTERIPYGGYSRSLKDDRILNDDYWRATSNDKLLTHAILKAQGFACAETRLICSPVGRGLGLAPVATSLDELMPLLKSQLAHGPLFMKPVSAGYGRGAALVVDYRDDGLLLSKGETLPRDRLGRILAFQPFNGLMFQEPIVQHPEIERRVGKGVSSIRFRVVRTAAELVCYALHWKITAGGSMVDNLGASGGRALLGGVDFETGRVGPVWNGKGLTAQKIETHPDTGQQIEGFLLPHWQKVKDYVFSAFRIFDGLWLQHWDVAIGPDGPIAVELNTESAIGFSQLAAENGRYIPALIQARRDHAEWKRKYLSDASKLASYEKDFLLT